MKKIFLILFVLNITYLNSQNGAYIEYKITGAQGSGGSVKINFSEFGSVSVFNMSVPQMPGGGFSMKHLNQKSNPGIIYMINEKDKTYSERKKEEAEKEDRGIHQVKKIGDETVNGYKCVHAQINENGAVSEVWNTKDIADYEKYSSSIKGNRKFGTPERDKALKDAGCDGMPVKILSKGERPDENFTMELVKIEKKNFSQNDFEIPAGYTKTEGRQGPPMGMPGMKSQQEIMNMSPEEREKFIEEMKKMGGGK